LRDHAQQNIYAFLNEQKLPLYLHITLNSAASLEAVAEVSQTFRAIRFVIGAESDLLMPINYIHEYSREINAVSVHVLPGGHGMRVEQYDALAAAIHDVCSRYDR